MIRINYPNDIEKFKDDYYSLISKHFKVSDIDTSIQKILSDWNLKKLLTSSFSELIIFQSAFKKHSNSNEKKSIDNFFIKNYTKIEKKGKSSKNFLYDEVRKHITFFLKEQNVNIKSCFYCNIEYVNNFEEIFSFKNEEEFLNDAPEVFLKKSGLSNNILNEITENRNKGYLPIKEFQFSPRKKKKVLDYCSAKKNEILKVDNEHYSLDHVIGKAEHPYLSLSIFNLVPCCSSCNSKFKHTKEFKIDAILLKIIPSSELYELNQLIDFKLKDAKDFINKTKEEDLIIELTNLDGNKIVDQYLSIFKLKGRYEYHKEKAFDIIDKRKKYPDTQINEVSKLLGITPNQIKKDIFGKECFESTNAPFEKYKKDIAKQIGLHLLPNDSSE